MAIKGIFGKLLCGALLFASLTAAGCGSGTESGTESGNVPPKEEEKREMTDHAVFDRVALPDSLWQETPQTIDDSENDRTERDIQGEIKAIYYRSDYNGQESYAFAFLGIPEGASETDKKPAVLLVHGGGGTAYWQWVKEWVNRGYVALAMDLEGHVPKKDGTSDNMPADLYTASEYTAPHNQNYGDAAQPIEQTWMYYAVATVIRGNTLLHSLNYVDRYKVGVCGVSWGGVITCIVTGYDDRFAFSAPIYCGLNLSESMGGNLAGYYKNHAGARVWDDDEGLSRVETPVFMLAMNNDTSAYPDSLSATVEHCKNGSVAFVRDWAHSHTLAFARPEPYAFADSIVKGTEWMKIVSQPNGTKGTVKVSLPEGRKAKAYIACANWTTGRPPVFEHFRLTLENGEVQYELTEEMETATGGVTHFYVWVVDDLDRVVSTYLQTV